jgi:hypothetical protein
MRYMSRWSLRKRGRRMKSLEREDFRRRMDRADGESAALTETKALSWDVLIQIYMTGTRTGTGTNT